MLSTPRAVRGMKPTTMKDARRAPFMVVLLPRSS